MQKIDFDELLTFWKPTIGVSHQIIFGSRRIKTIKFKNKDGSDHEKKVLEIDILNIDGKVYNPFVSFSSGNYYFLQQMRPIIERADSKNQAIVSIILLNTADRKYVVSELLPRNNNSNKGESYDEQ